MSYTDKDTIRDMADEARELIREVQEINSPSLSHILDGLTAIVQMACRHSWVAGMMYVNDDDLDAITRERKAKGLPAPECERCQLIYG